MSAVVAVGSVRYSDKDHPCPPQVSFLSVDSFRVLLNSTIESETTYKQNYYRFLNIFDGNNRIIMHSDAPFSRDLNGKVSTELRKALCTNSTSLSRHIERVLTHGDIYRHVSG